VPEFIVTEAWRYKVKYRVTADDEDAARFGNYEEGKPIEEVSRDDGEYEDTLEVEPVE